MSGMRGGGELEEVDLPRRPAAGAVPGDAGSFCR